MKKTLKSWLQSAVLLAGIALAGHGQAATEKITYYHNDISGTPVLATDASGNVVWKENYRPYGQKLNNRAPSGTTNRIGYAGKPFDDNTGLSYMGARYYDPVLGRFTGIDPKEVTPNDLHSFNRYAYANNNPYKFVDPDGRAAFAIIPYVAAWIAGGAAVSGGVNAAFQYEQTGQVRWGGLGGVADAAGDGAILGPVFAGVAARGVTGGVDAAAVKGLPDSALVCRGGACKAENFLNGSGVTRAGDGTLSGVSTQSRAGASVDELAKPFKNNQVGVTTAGDIRRAGGRVTADGHRGNPNHATVDGLTAQQLEKLFSPTRPNPVPPAQRGF